MLDFYLSFKGGVYYMYLVLVKLIKASLRKRTLLPFRFSAMPFGSSSCQNLASSHVMLIFAVETLTSPPDSRKLWLCDPVVYLKLKMWTSSSYLRVSLSKSTKPENGGAVEAKFTSRFEQQIHYILIECSSVELTSMKKLSGSFSLCPFSSQDGVGSEELERRFVDRLIGNALWHLLFLNSNSLLLDFASVPKISSVLS